MTQREIAFDEALAACAKITRIEARNFYHGLRLLPRTKRDALCAVYAWMRVADDIADDESRAADARRDALDRFERMTLAAFGERAPLDEPEAEGERSAAVRVALAGVAREWRLSSGDFLAAIEGQRMDLEPRVYRTFADVEKYCDRVASTVGRICLDVWGVRAGADAELARELATRRGIAFQLTNILRDVREDLARGRVYLPADELASNALTAHALVAWESDARCARFMQVQCARAERIFAESAALDGMVSPDAVATIRAMSAIYRGILRKIARDPSGAMRTRARLTTMTKSWIALRARLGLLGARA